jgi:CubicO group peptidase (beta-lactamase class C family)
MSELFDKLCKAAWQGNWPLFGLAMISDRWGTEKMTCSNRCHDIYSVAKAFTVTAAGLAYDRGLLKTTDRVTDVLADLVPDGIDERWHKLTVHDVMLHMLGMPEGFLDIDVYTPGSFGTDYLDFLFRHPFESEPVETYNYTDAAYYLMSRVVEKAVGEPIDDLMWRELFAPMNYAEMAWSHCPQGHPMGATGLYISVVDMVKLGELYRKGGVWEGRQLISKEWVDTVIQNRYELKPTGAADSYGKGGMYGQQLAVFPSLGLSVGWQGFRFRNGRDLLNMIAEYSGAQGN